MCVDSCDLEYASDLIFTAWSLNMFTSMVLEHASMQDLVSVL
jgi:hypothetical protein